MSKRPHDPEDTDKVSRVATLWEQFVRRDPQIILWNTRDRMFTFRLHGEIMQARWMSMDEQPQWWCDANVVWNLQPRPSDTVDTDDTPVSRARVIRLLGKDLAFNVVDALAGQLRISVAKQKLIFALLDAILNTLLEPLPGEYGKIVPTMILSVCTAGKERSVGAVLFLHALVDLAQNKSLVATAKIVPELAGQLSGVNTFFTGFLKALEAVALYPMARAPLVSCAMCSGEPVVVHLETRSLYCLTCVV